MTDIYDQLKTLGIELNHHEALSDARACALITLRAEAQRVAGISL